jgi:hypothetical protein
VALSLDESGWTPWIDLVDAASLAEAYRLTKRGQETYTVDRVPPTYLRLVAD